MIGFEEAVEAMRAVAPTARRETVSLGDAVGRVTFAEVRARTALPTARSAAMDGFACRADDTASASPDAPVRLRLVDASQAGTPADRSVRPGEAVAVSTGAVIPEGADAIVIAERAEQQGDVIEVVGPAATKHVRPVGEDLEVGVIVLKPGTLLGPRAVSLAASAGWERLAVGSLPSALVVATGPELRTPSSELGAGDVPDSNGPLVAAALRRFGVTVRVGEPVIDDEAALAATIDAGIASARSDGASPDLIVTTGGASIGRHDVVRRVLMAQGNVTFDGIRVRPGRPTMLGRWRETPWLALPGTPHAVAVLGALLMRAWAEAAVGKTSDDSSPQRIPAVLDGELRGVPRRTVLALARSRHDATGVRRVAPLRRSPASRMLDVLAADAIVVVPEGTDLGTGDVVETLDFRAA